ncbi:unnamed protein product [Blepharisma stoltei]|uniref:Acidic leucine-rich nuclear phosphoprotein 32 family member A n=1 Tax=Blepharisma stoltei TaxID=1481888 RepID=A0AAU9IEI4_9CILI|nr:unnamed protein product [Blepharisma stoltei]
MEKLIQKQTQGNGPEEVDELILDNWRGASLTVQDKSILETFPNLEVLSLTGCGLKSLENFPRVPSLCKLELSDNKIKGGLENLSHLTQLYQLSLAGNQIAKFDDLAPLTNLENLISLDLFGCPVAELPDFNTKVQEMLPNLEVLNRRDKEGNEVESSSDSDEEEENENDLEDFIENDLNESDGDKPHKKQKINEENGDIEENESEEEEEASGEEEKEEEDAEEESFNS